MTKSTTLLTMRNEVHTIGELINAYITAVKGADFVDSQRIVNSWKSVVGDFIASHTLDVYYSNNKLFVRVDSDVLRSELSYARTALMQHLNSIVGRQLVKNIYFN